MSQPDRSEALHGTSSHTKQVAEFAGDVAYYLTLEPRQLPSHYLYDALGSALFEAICELPWYGVTRAELALLEAHGDGIFSHTAPLSRIVELGPGNGSKLLTLMRAAGSPAKAGHDVRGSHLRGQPLELHLIDVSANALDQSKHALDIFGGVAIVRHHATYETGLSEVARGRRPGGRTLVLFLGSNIGNFDPPGADAFLRAIRTALDAGDDLLIGTDLIKPEAELLLAYDDPLGVTAAFNKNLLVRINRELGADLDVASFDHRAVWNRDASRIEMHLVSRRRQRVRVPLAHIDVVLEEGETIWTESSYKYEPEELTAFLARAGFRTVEHWTAGEERFALALVRAED